MSRVRMRFVENIGKGYRDYDDVLLSVTTPTDVVLYRDPASVGAPLANVAKLVCRRETWEMVDIDANLGMVWEAGDPMRLPGARARLIWRARRTDWGGVCVFATREDRDEAIDALKWIGAKYWTDFKDVQGYGLSWAMKIGR